MSFFNSLGRSMTRSQRPAKRSPTPTSENPSNGALSPTTPHGNGSSLPSPKFGDNRRPSNASSRSQTERDEKPKGPPPLYLSQPFVKAALVKGNFKTIVMLPKYCDVNEWVAINMFDFYNNLNTFYGVLSEFCTLSSCPTMAAGPNLDYTWIDSSRKQVKLPAPTYVDYVFTWIQILLDDSSVFPTKSGQQFSPAFASTAKNIYRQMLRVFAHCFHSHYTHLLHLHSEPHFNSLFAHFLAFGKEYDLLDIKDVKGLRGAEAGIGDLWEKWKEMGILETDPQTKAS